jgi:biotin/methionine sulfoxide reductase
VSQPGAQSRTPTAAHWGTYVAVREGDRLVALEPVGDDPDASPIGPGIVGTLDHRARITEPMVRKGWLERGPEAPGPRGAEPFVAVSWERALDLVAGELDRVRVAHGNAAIYGGSYGWASAGRFHHAQSQIHRFLNAIGGYTASVGSYSAGALEVLLPHVIGGGPVSIWQRGPMFDEIERDGELVVSFGGMAPKNAQMNVGGVGRHQSAGWQLRCREAGVAFVTVSPLCDDADERLGAEWIAPRPNSDVALMLGLAHEIVRRDLHDRDFLARCCSGWERFARYLTGDDDGVPKDAAWAAGLAGIDPAAIRSLAERIATHRTVVNVAWSLQRADHGEQAYWMGVTLAALSGSMGRSGGGFASGLGISLTGVRPQRQPVASLPQGRNAVDGAIPVARIADALLHPGEPYDFDGERRTYPDLRLVYWAGGNPFHHHQDLNRLVRAWQRPETVIVHDSWWNPLTRFADVVFPVATALERNDLAAGANDVSLMAMQRAVDPPAGVRTDYETFAGLARRLGVEQQFTEGRSAEAWVRHLYEKTRTWVEPDVELPPFDEFWSAGTAAMPAPPRRAVGDFAALRADPVAHPLATPSGRIEIFSETIASFGYRDCPGHPTWLEPAEWLGGPQAARFPLHLCSNQPRTRLHSQYDHGAYSQDAKIAGREPVLLHPEDAGARGIADGDVVRLFNDRGACLAGARVTDAVRPGVVVLATGAWYDPEQPGVPGSLDRHGNPNVLTLDKGTSSLAQASSAGTTLIEIRREIGEIGDVAAFERPAIERETS